MLRAEVVVVRLVASVLFLILMACGLFVGLSTWTYGEVVNIEASEASSRRGGRYTQCTAWIRYEVDGAVHQTRDTKGIRLGSPVSDCPFDRGQTAIVLYTDQHPEIGSAYTTSGSTLFGFVGSLIFFPLMLAGAIRMSPTPGE